MLDKTLIVMVWVLVLVVTTLICITAPGCQSRIDGGSTQQSGRQLLMEFGPDGQIHRISDGRSFSATTQPSIRGNGKMSLDAMDDMISGASYAPSVERFKYQWPLALLFFAAAVAVGWWLKRYGTAVVLGCLGILAALSPAGLAIGAGLLAIFLIHRAYMKPNEQLRAGIAEYLTRINPGDVEQTKAILRRKQDPATQAMVKSMNGLTLTKG